MLLPHLKFIFTVSLVYVSIVGWSGNSWLMIWFTMEIGFLLFVGFVLVDLNCGIIELMIKYFISQVFISLMFSSLMVVSLFNLSFCLSLILCVVLIMKLGMFPFHSWVIAVLGKLDWMSFLLMTTFVKLLPILLLYYLNIFFSFGIVLALSTIVGSLMGLGNTVIQKLLGYSSLVHLCWLLLSLEISIKMFLIYFFCYFFMMFTFICVFGCMNIYYINQFKLFSGSMYIKFLVFFLVLSFAGFPPFLGFMMKWLVLSSTGVLDFKLLVFLMVSTSLFSVLFYLELFFYFMMLLGSMVNWYSYSFGGMVWGSVLILFSYLFIYFFI